MDKTFLSGANAPYVAELFFKFKKNRNSIDKSWADFFNLLNEEKYKITKTIKSWRAVKTFNFGNNNFKKF